MKKLLTHSVRFTVALFSIILLSSSLQAQTIDFRLSGPYYSLANRMVYYIEAQSSHTGMTETTMRLFFAEAQHDPTNTVLTNSEGATLFDTQITVLNPSNTTNTGELFGLPCDMVFVAGNLDYQFEEVNAWRRVGAIELGIYTNLNPGYCANIIFDESSTGYGYGLASEGIETIISSQALGSNIGMSETAEHWNWVETSPTPPVFGAPTVSCQSSMPCTPFLATPRPERPRPFSGGKMIDINSQVTIYPTIASDIVSIKNLRDVHSIQVFSLSGVALDEMNSITDQSTLELNISDYSFGTYFISVRKLNGDSEILKFIKQ